MAQSNKDLARIDYLHGMKYKELAEKYKVSLSTVKSWKTRYKWERKSLHTNDEMHTKAKKGTRTKKSTQENQKVMNDIDKKVEEEHKQKLEREIDKMLINDQLNDKQKLFCMYYIKCFNATKAYLKAYDCDYISAMTNGSRLLSNDKIRAEIQRLKADKFKGAMLSIQDLLQKYIDIALSDITDYVEFGQEEVPVMTMFGPAKDEDGNEITKLINVVKFKDSHCVDGTLISEVGQGKDGAKIKLMDKKFALDFLTKYTGLLDKPTQAKLDIERRKMELAEKSADTLDDDIEYAVEGGQDEDKKED